MGSLLEGKVAVITGSGRGIGRAMAELFASEGAAVVVNDVDEAPANEAKQAIEAKGGKCVAVAGSVTNVADCEKLAKAAADLGGGAFDILVNNAGTTRDKTIHNMTDELWHFIVDIVLKGAFNMIRAASPYMRDAAKKEMESGAPKIRKIVNISSIAGVRGNAGQANYASAKAGVIGLTKTIAREWGKFQVCSNCIAPGFIETRLTAPKESPDSPIGLPPGAGEMAKMMIPLNRTGKPEDIANVALFLSSHLSDYVSGQCIIVDGGMV